MNDTSEVLSVHNEPGLSITMRWRTEGTDSFLVADVSTDAGVRQDTLDYGATCYVLRCAEQKAQPPQGIPSEHYAFFYADLIR